MNNSADVPVGAGGGHEETDAPGAFLARLPERAAVADLADVFSLLGDPSRLRLLLALREGELCVGDLSQVTEHSESAVSHSLKLLRAHRIVAVRREGRRAFYRLDDPHVRMLLDLAISHAAHSEMEHPERREVGEDAS